MISKKIKAALIHLLISAIIVAAFYLFVRNYWYPFPFFTVSGISTIILILVAVDVVLGPLLTFIVFNPKKPSLKFDLSIIAFIQLMAFGYGVYTIYEAHPLYVPYAIDRFTPINANEVSPLKARVDELRKSKLTGPTLVYVEKPTDPEELSRVLMEALSGKPDIDARPEYYKPFEQFKKKVLGKGLDPELLFITESDKSKLSSFLKEHGKKTESYVFLALSGQAKDVLWVWDKNTEKSVDIIDVSPWK